MIGIRDVARHLNISIGTVSRALNGKADVNAETRQRVLAAAATLGYSPNQSGRSLRHGTTDVIAVLIPTSREQQLFDFGFGEVLEALRRVLSGHGLDLAVFLYDEDLDAFAHLCRVAERRLADGLIIADTLRTDRRIDYLIEKKIPFVAFGRTRSGGTHAWVDIDIPGAVTQAVGRLVQEGHRRIGLLMTENERNFMGLAREAFRRALKAHGCEADAELVQRVSHGEDSGYLGGSELLALKKPPTAVLTQDGKVAVGLYRRLNEAGLQPGRDVAVVSLLGDTQAQFLSPALTSFHAQFGLVGTRLAQALLASLPKWASDPKAPAIQELIPMVMSASESSGAIRPTAPSRDHLLHPAMLSRPT
ncbi:MAG: LacI family DNA-binding transcriptional regulator [Rhizobacter sp.]